MKLPALILTHAAMVGLGWAFIGSTFPATSTKTPRLPGKSERREERLSPAREILARIDAEMPPSFHAPTAEKKAAIQQAAESRLATLALPSDLEAAVEEAYLRKEPPASDAELGALLLGWGRRDLAAAAGWLDRSSEPPRRDVIEAIGEKLGYEIDPAAALKLEGHHFDDDESFLKGLARQLFDTCSLDQITAFAHSSHESVLSELPHALVSHWPSDRADDLVEFASSMPEGELGSYVYQRVLDNTSLAPEIRMQLLLEIGPGESGEASKRELLLSRDLSGFLRPEGQPEPEQAFKVGRSDAIGLLRDFQQRFPGYYGESDLRAALFAKLGPIDPLRAAALLAPLDPPQRRAAIESALGENGPIHPDVLRECFSLLPVPSDEAGLRESFALWERSARFYRHYGMIAEDYRDWVLHLPAGVNRDLALAALAAGLESDHPEEAAGFREQISHPAIKDFH